MELLEAAESIRTKRLSPVEVVGETLKTIREKNPQLNAYITVCEEEALQQAAEAEEEIRRSGARSVFHGVPIAVKDLICTAGIRTTMGSQLYKDFIPPHDAAVVRKLKEAGAIIIGKTNTHEFAYGPIGDRSYFGAARNPYDPDKITGGSSSGSGAAVAAGMAAAAIGTDTGGSIRIPASACGVVGMKPTFGRVSKAGIHDLAYTLDHPGPLTKGVRENALLLNVLAGFDPDDPYSLQAPETDFGASLKAGVKEKVIGLPSFYFRHIDPEVRKAIERVCETYNHLGAEVREVEIGVMDEIAAAQVITIQAEAAAVHAKNMEERGAEYDPEVFERLQASKEVRGYEYVIAQQKRKGLIARFNAVFDEVDVLLAPTLPVLPTDIGQREVTIGDYTETVRSALLRLTAPANYTGNPSLSVPCGFSESGLPIGFQLIGKHLQEAELYRFGRAYEAASE